MVNENKKSIKKEIKELKEQIYKLKIRQEIIAGYTLSEEQFNYVFDGEYWGDK